MSKSIICNTMKKFNRSKCAYFLFISFAIVAVSCKKDNSPSPPSLPPQSSFVIDFTNFSNGASASLPSVFTKSFEVLTNYQAAALKVGYWNTILYLKTAIPAACFKEAFKHKGSYLSTNTWEWKYNLTLETNNIAAKLQAKLITDSVQWQMLISVTGDSLAITDFVWFTGTSALDGSGGTWIINESPSLPNPLFSINWIKRNSQIGSVQYTYVKPGENATGNFIKFGTKDSTLVVNNVYYILHNVNPVTYDIDIEWNSMSKAGRYQDINGWHCWDSGKLNINCN